jgi:hypothetical protein
MEHSMTGSVGSGTGSLNSVLAEFLSMSTEATLENPAVFDAAEGHAHVFEFDNNFGSHTAHEFYGVLIAKVIASLDGVEHVPDPVVGLHVAQGRRNASLSRYRMRAGREDLADDSSIDNFGSFERSSKSCPAGSYNHNIVFMNNDIG